MPIQQLSGFIVPVGFLILFYFLLIRPQKKKEKEIQEMRSRLKVGDHVTTIGAMTGKIIRITEDTVTIETGSDKTRITLEKWGVGKVNTEK
ncbi:preprotein translocase subunit YajC [Filifactor villosus]|uniref:Preprotein translocase subunit YajC n=1 Tax=Filifactor villosus TaxID=29374 RepID=A0ABV9QJU7_9FIRM